MPACPKLPKRQAVSSKCSFRSLGASCVGSGVCCVLCAVCCVLRTALFVSAASIRPGLRAAPLPGLHLLPHMAVVPTQFAIAANGSAGPPGCNKGASALRTCTRSVVPRGQKCDITSSISSARRTSPSAKSRLPTAPSAKRPTEGPKVALQGQRPHGTEWTQRCVSVRPIFWWSLPTIPPCNIDFGMSQLGNSMHIACVGTILAVTLACSSASE